MPKPYRIRDGFSFVAADQSVQLGGEIIQLDDDVAEQHRHKLEPVASGKQKKPAGGNPSSDSADPAAGAGTGADPAADADPAAGE